MWYFVIQLLISCNIIINNTLLKKNEGVMFSCKMREKSLDRMYC